MQESTIVLTVKDANGVKIDFNNPSGDIINLVLKSLLEAKMTVYDAVSNETIIFLAFNGQWFESFNVNNSVNV